MTTQANTIELSTLFNEEQANEAKQLLLSGEVTKETLDIFVEYVSDLVKIPEGGAKFSKSQQDAITKGDLSLLIKKGNRYYDEDTWLNVKPNDKGNYLRTKDEDDSDLTFALQANDGDGDLKRWGNTSSVVYLKARYEGSIASQLVLLKFESEIITGTPDTLLALSNEFKETKLTLETELERLTNLLIETESKIKKVDQRVKILFKLD